MMLTATMTQQSNRWQGMDFKMEEIGGSDTGRQDGRQWAP
jgi:hypothetical protein